MTRLPNNLALIDEDIKLLDISAADVYSRDFIIAVNGTFLMNKLGPIINIFAYRWALTLKIVRAMGKEWRIFKTGMSDFHNPAFLEKPLPSRRAIRDRKWKNKSPRRHIFYSRLIFGRALTILITNKHSTGMPGMLKSAYASKI